MYKVFNKKYKLLTIALILGIANLHIIASSTCEMVADHSCSMETGSDMTAVAEQDNDSCCSTKENTCDLPAQKTFTKNLNECNCFHYLDNTTDLIISKTEKDFSSFKLIATLLPQTQISNKNAQFYFDRNLNPNSQSIPIYLISHSFLI